MWTTVSSFLPYSSFIILAMTRAFPWYPICRGSIGLKWFRLATLHNSGSGPTISIMWTAICFKLYSYMFKHWLQTTSFSVFFGIFSSLITKHNSRHNHHNHGRRRRKWPPSTPHEALRSALMLWMNRLHSPELADVILWGWRVCMAAPLFRQWWIATTSECFEGHTHPQPPPKSHP